MRAAVRAAVWRATINRHVCLALLTHPPLQYLCEIFSPHALIPRAPLDILLALRHLLDCSLRGLAAS